MTNQAIQVPSNGVVDQGFRALIAARRISSTEDSPYRTKFEVRGTLAGPLGYGLGVVTLWIRLKATGEPRFVTLFPDRERNRDEH